MVEYCKSLKCKKCWVYSYYFPDKPDKCILYSKVLILEKIISNIIF